MNGELWPFCDEAGCFGLCNEVGASSVDHTSRQPLLGRGQRQ